MGRSTQDWKYSELEKRNKELEAENKRLVNRCSPNAVVMIGDRGFYVQQIVADHITNLKASTTASEIIRLKRDIESLGDQVADLDTHSAELQAKLDAVRPPLENMAKQKTWSEMDMDLFNRFVAAYDIMVIRSRQALKAAGDK